MNKADGLVVGSAICKEITRSLNSRQNPVTNIVRLVKEIKKIKFMNWLTKAKNFGEKNKKGSKKKTFKRRHRKF